MRHILPNKYLLGIGVFLLSYILILGVRRLLSTKISHFFGQTQNSWDDLVAGTIERTGHFFMVGSAIYTGFHFLPEYAEHAKYAHRFYFILIMWQVGIWGHHLLDNWIENVLNQKLRKSPAAASSISLVQLFAKITFFAIIFLFTLNNLDIKITTIVAGLGVGGIAVALALQKILGDLFSSLSIVLDKPFMIGDFIVFDTYMGEVEKIGLKTTHIRSLSGEQIIASNSDLLAARIRNFKRMHERRVSFILGLTHKNNVQALKRAVSLITAIIKSQSRIRFERCHFMRINSSFDIETVYWVLSNDYDLYMDIHQKILMEICQTFEQEGLVFALPTQTVQVAPTEVYMKTDTHALSDLQQKSLS